MSASAFNAILVDLICALFAFAGGEWHRADRGIDQARDWCEKGLAYPRCSYQRIHSFKKAAELDPGCRRAYRELGESYYDLAIAYGHQDLYRQAADALAAALRLDPADAAVRYRLGTIYFLLKDFAGARRELEAARRIDPSFAPASDSLRLLENR